MSVTIKVMNVKFRTLCVAAVSNNLHITQKRFVLSSTLAEKRVAYISYVEFLQNNELIHVEFSLLLKPKTSCAQLWKLFV